MVDDVQQHVGQDADCHSNRDHATVAADLIQAHVSAAMTTVPPTEGSIAWTLTSNAHSDAAGNRRLISSEVTAWLMAYT